MIVRFYTSNFSKRQMSIALNCLAFEMIRKTAFKWYHKKKIGHMKERMLVDWNLYFLCSINFQLNFSGKYFRLTPLCRFMHFIAKGQWIFEYIFIQFMHIE